VSYQNVRYLTYSELTPREKEAARLAASGASNKTVASEMAVGEGAVKQYLSRAYDKLGIENRGQLRYKVESLK
jgi:DNA-binding NarL/FixJ family response regulator